MYHLQRYVWFHVLLCCYLRPSGKYLMNNQDETNSTMFKYATK